MNRYKILILSAFLIFIKINSFPVKYQHQVDDNLITYWLSASETSSTYPLVVLIGGSDCKSCYNAHLKFEKLILKNGFGVLSVEKRGIDDIKIDEKKHCEQNTIYQRVMDIKTILNSLKILEWDGSIIIVGGSEGAMVGALLTAECNAITKAAILIAGIGSYNFYKEADILIEKNCELIKFGKALSIVLKVYYKLAMAFAYQFPNSTIKLFGHTLKYWVSFESATNAIFSNLENIDTPLYLVHGKNDLMSLYESAYDLYEQFKSNGKNIVFKTLDSGHDLNDSIEEVICEALDWVKEELKHD